MSLELRRVATPHCHSVLACRGGWMRPASSEACSPGRESAFAFAFVAQSFAHFAKFCGFSALWFCNGIEDDL